LSPAGLLLIAFLFAGFWLVVVRPQRRSRTKRAEMVAKLGVGREVVTVGGLYGTVHALTDDTIDLEIAPGVVSRFDRRAVAYIVEPDAAVDAQGEPSAEAVDEAAVGLPPAPAQPSQPASR
jgi:preprotein translocase subunit YajC